MAFALVFMLLATSLYVGALDFRTRAEAPSRGVPPVPSAAAPFLSPLAAVPYVSTTLNLLDGAVLAGASNGYGASQPTDMVFDSAHGEVYAAAQLGQDIVYLNASSSHIDGTIQLSTGAAAPIGAGPTAAPWGLALDNSTGLLYVSHQTDFLTVIDTATHRLVQSISLGERIGGMSIDWKDHRLYASDSGLGTVDVLSTQNNTTLSQIFVGSSPEWTAYDPVNGAVFVTVQSNRTVAQIDTATDRVVRWIAVSFVPFGITYDPATREIDVTGCSALYNVSAIDPLTGAVLRSGTTGNCGTMITYLEGLHRLAISNQIGPNFFVVNDTTLKLATTVYAGGSQTFGFAFDAADNLLYVAEDAWLRLGVFSTPTFTTPFHLSLVGSVMSAAYVPYQNVLDVLDYWQNLIDQVNLTTGVVTSNHPVGSQPDSIVYDAITNEIYVANTAGGGLQALFPGNLSLAASVPLTYGPGPLAYDTRNGHIFTVGSTSCGFSGCYYLYDVDPVSHSVVGTTAIAGFYALQLAYDEQHDRIYIPSGVSDSLIIVNATSDLVVGQAAAGSVTDGVAYDPIDGTVWVANQNSNNVTVIDPTRGSSIHNLSTGWGGTTYVAFDPALNAMIVVTTNGSLNYRFFNASTDLPMGNYTFPFVFWGVGANGGMTYLPGARALAIVDAGVVGFLERVPDGPAIASLTASPVLTSVGHPGWVNVSAESGVAPLTYSYLGLPPGCLSADSSQLPCTPTTPGSYWVQAVVTDSNGTRASSNVSLTVLPAITLGPITASVPVGATGRPLVISVNATGGVGGDAFSWSGTPSNCLVGGTSWLRCTPTVSGNYSVSVVARDSEGTATASGPISLDVRAPLSATLDANRTFLDLGQSLDFNASTSGGTYSYAYSWQGLPAGCVGVNSSRISCTPSAVGNSTVQVNVTDFGGAGQVVASVFVSVNADPTLVALVASRLSLDVGQSDWIAVYVGNGSAPYAYDWTGLPTGCSPSNWGLLNCTPTAAGVFNVSVIATDAAGLSVGAGPLTLLVSPAIGAITISSNRSGVDLGGSFSLTAGFSGGIGPFAVTWLGLPAGCVSLNALALACTPNATGAYSVSVEITDAVGAALVGPPLVLVVYPTLVASPPTTSAPVRDVGQTLTVTEIATGGSASYAYVWSGLPSGCPAGNSSIISCTLSSADVGNWSIHVSVWDSAGFRYDPFPVTVRVYPLLTAALSANVALDVGQGLKATVTISGGASLSSVTWFGLPSDCVPPALSTSLTLSCTPSRPETFNVSVVVTDGSGVAVATPSIEVDVSSTPALGTLNASRSSLDVGQATRLSGTIASVGSGGITLLWWNLPTGCPQPSGPVLNLTCVASLPGRFTPSLEITDSNGGTATSATVTIMVDADPAVLSLNRTPDPIVPNGSLTLTIDVVGGSGGYSIGWWGLPQGCVAPSHTALSFTCRPSGVGDYTVNASATDSNGFRVESLPVVVHVRAEAGQPVSTGPTPSYDYTVIVLVALVAIGGVGVTAFLLRRRRGPGREGPPPEEVQTAAEEVEYAAEP